MAVTGNLKDMNLVNLISINCNEMSQSRLLVKNRDQEAVIYFEGGEIVHAIHGTEEGEKAFYGILGWDEGEFELEPGVASPKKSITTRWSNLLLEGMQRIDESAGDEGTPRKREEIEVMSFDDLVKKLTDLEGIEGAVLVARDGTILASKMESDERKEGAMAVFTGNAATQIGEILSLGAFERGVYEVSGARRLVVEQPDYYVGLQLGERVSPAIIASQINSLLH